MKLNMKTLCSVGALLLCSESALAMKEVSNKNRSTHPPVVQLKEDTGSMKIIVYPSIADCLAFLTSDYNIHGVDEDTLSSIEDIVKHYDVLVRYYGLMGSDKLQRISRERKIYQNLLDRFKDAKCQRIVEAQEAKAEAKHLGIIDKPIESVDQMFEEAENEASINESIELAARMFKEAENEASIDESIESAVQMFDDAEIEAARTPSQAVVNQSSYFKFGQFFKSMWSKFTESKLGQALNFVKSYFFQN